MEKKSFCRMFDDHHCSMIVFNPMLDKESAARWRITNSANDYRQLAKLSDVQWPFLTFSTWVIDRIIYLLYLKLFTATVGRFSHVVLTTPARRYALFVELNALHFLLVDTFNSAVLCDKKGRRVFRLAVDDTIIWKRIFFSFAYEHPNKLSLGLRLYNGKWLSSNDCRCCVKFSFIMRDFFLRLMFYWLAKKRVFTVANPS
ncbi:hypothetical protein T4D_243 [Trichinella pseudospiralis]|uniref:Uncharacterized protein n=1 Tax=Trichinella pseudospiralis TaxID=6337 RepID=A0A0V1F9U1_TRIPS|nr:hypothetical protein T4D_243 [Trichinella pseudospiralis]